MARTIGELTALAITRANRRGYYGNGGGLFLQVSATGSKSRVFRFRDAGKLREMGRGPTLAEARQKALECRKARLDGKTRSTRDALRGWPCGSTQPRR